MNIANFEKTSSLQPAYILHARSYRDTSLLLELFTQNHGRVSAVARGAKGNRSRFKGLLQPFVPLLVAWYGKSELLTLTLAESCGISHYLSGDQLLCGLYLNELLIRLLHQHDAHPQLFHNYQSTLSSLSKKTILQADDNIQQSEVALRTFEKYLLFELGYALELTKEAKSGKPIHPEQFYYFVPDHGMLPYEKNSDEKNPETWNIFSGKNLLAIHANQFDEKNLRDGKRLLRMALHRLLGGKTIRSRELFLQKG